jgi:hypothetical protein
LEEDELDLTAAAAPGADRSARWAWLSRPLVQRLAVGVAVLVASGALSVALLDTPSADRVRTEEGADDIDGGRRSEGRRAPGDGGSGTTVDDADGGGAGVSSTKGGRRAGPREGRGGDRGDKSRDRERSPGRGGGGEGSTTTVTTGPPTGAPGSLLVEPSGTLPALAPVELAPDRPCPSGTGAVEVRITATGGPLDGQVLLVESVAPAPDGSWSVPDLVVPAVAGVEGVGWAATAPSVTFDAACDGGSAYAPATVGLSAVGETPGFEVVWDGTTASATATACPTHVRLEVFVGPTAPVLDGEVEPTASEPMAPDAGDPTTWTGSISPTYDAGSDGVWASASCLDRSEGRPVWRHTLVQLAAPDSAGP